MAGSVPGILKPSDALPQNSLLLRFFRWCIFLKFSLPTIDHGLWQCIGKTEGDCLDQFRRIQMRQVSARVPAFVLRIFRHDGTWNASLRLAG